MRYLLFILLLYCEANAQMMNGSRFIYSALTDASPASYSSGTHAITRKKYTNLNTGVNSGNGLYITGTANVTIQNSAFISTIRKGISVENFSGTLIVENSFFANNETAFEIATSDNCTIIIRNCQGLNMWGGKRCQGQFVQVEDSGPVSVLITGNRIENKRGESYAEDIISFYNSSGTSGDPMTVSNNMTRGGGPSESGGGFMFGDTGGSWQTGQNNKLDRPGNYLLAISNGENINLSNNKAYQPQTTWSNIGMYCYKVVAGHACGTNTVTGNDIYIRNDVGANNYWYAGDVGESCGTITGVTGGDFLATNFNDLTEAELGVPFDLIDYVSTDILWRIRDEAVQFRNQTETCAIGTWAADLARPTSDAGPDDTESGSAYTLVGSGSTGATSYRWVQVSGPNVATLTAPTSANCVVNDMIPGIYEFRLEAYDSDGASDGDWVKITMTP